MGIEPSPRSLHVVEITNDNYDDRPKPSKSEVLRSVTCRTVCSFSQVFKIFARPMSESWEKSVA